MAAVTVGAPRATDPGLRGPVPARTSGPAAADRSPATVRPGRTVRSWPLLVLAAPAAAEVWSGWVGIAQKTGFGLVSPLPGSGPRCTWTPPSPCRSAWRPTRRTRCAPGWPASTRSAPGPAGSPSGRRSSRSRSAWPGRSPTTCWPRPGWRGRRGPSPRSCPACRSWSWPWGPRWPTCCAPTPPRGRAGQQDRRTSHTRGPPDRSPGTRPGPGRTEQRRP